MPFKAIHMLIYSGESARAGEQKSESETAAIYQNLSASNH